MASYKAAFVVILLGCKAGVVYWNHPNFQEIERVREDKRQAQLQIEEQKRQESEQFDEMIRVNKEAARTGKEVPKNMRMGDAFKILFGIPRSEKLNKKSSPSAEENP